MVARGVWWGVGKMDKGGTNYKIEKKNRNKKQSFEQPFIRAALKKVVIEGNLHNMIKDLCENLKAIIKVIEILNTFLLRLGEKQGCLLYLFY